MLKKFQKRLWKSGSFFCPVSPLSFLNAMVYHLLMKLKAENTSFKIVYVYEIQENLDKLEGHGAFQTIGYVGDETLARKMIHLNPTIPGRVVKRTALCVPDGRYFLLMDSNPIRIDSSMEDAERAVALAKLTPQERHLLGLE